MTERRDAGTRPARRPPERLVLDTNVWLDLLLFEDPACRHLANALVDGHARTHRDRFRVEAPERLPGAWDAGGIRRMLENLGTNAVKHGTAGSEVTVRLLEAEDRVLVKVHNLGAPLQNDEQETVFEPFRRSEAAQVGGREGWGIGLTLVRGIAEAHGGIVKVRSLADEGTTFIIDLPRHAQPPVD